MTPALLLEIGILPAARLLPPVMDRPEARALVLAICLQESLVKYRRQMGDGPARGFAQFERAGIRGVLTHRASAAHAKALCQTLVVADSVSAVYAAIEFNDVLMSGFARLLLWTLPDPLPRSSEPDLAWNHYLAAWRPGKPRPESWPSCFLTAWDTVGRPA